MELRSDLSKQYISEALIELLRAKEYNDISIQEIVDRAGLSRMAYYRNFRSKDDILRCYLDRVTEAFITQTQIRFDPTRFQDYLVVLFTHLLAQKEIGLLLLKADLSHFLKDVFDQIFQEKSESTEQQYRYAFLSGGLYNLYLHWLNNGCKETPEELAAMFPSKLQL